MTKKILFFICWIFYFSTFAQATFLPEEMVNTVMGTDSKRSFSNGNTYPAIATPWGMNFWTPQTGTNGDGWQYQYSADKIKGFKQTHQPSPWIGDYGQFSIMPMTGKLNFKENKRGSWFSHKAEIAKPYYYSVFLSDYDVLTEITPTERSAFFRFTFPKADSSFILIDAFDRGSYIKILPEAHKIIGYTTRNRGGVPANFKNYFVIECDKAFNLTFTVNDSLLTKAQNEVTSTHAQAIIGFSTKRGEKIHLKIASSFISLEQAELNLKREIGEQSFDQIQTKAKTAWHNELIKVKAEGGTEEQLKTFYSCLYRMLLFPRKFYELDAQNQIVHYSPYNGRVEKGYMFTDTGFWDTFRSLFPFLTIMYPEMDGHILEGLANTYKESGWLPEWASPGHRGSMIGSNSASIITDAYLKGVRGFDINVLYEALLKNTEGQGPINTVGRNGAKQYNELGYVPLEGFGGSTAKTLEYAHADFCLNQLAIALKKPKEEIEKFAKRSQNYKNMFDPNYNLMRGKNQNGTFPTAFDPFKWGYEFVEGNSWHYSWSVLHDFKGLSDLMGGNKKMEIMLDSVYHLPPIIEESYYKGIIHEMTEMQVMNMGQYAHGNQPIQHMIYIYNFCGVPWKSQMHVRDAMDKLYKPTSDGYCGDEDNGQTSAWYVFSAMGFYSVCPGTQQYVIGSPLFKKVTLSLENGKKFIIEAPQNNQKNVYIQSATLNGTNYDKNYLSHFDITKGGILQFKMSETPNFKRGISKTALPFSFSK
jgi:predicted alpha-1,2-mannosidase